MTNILLISYSFPPLLLPESIQAARTASALIKKGWNIFAVTGNERHSSDYIDKQLNELVDKKIRIFKANSLESKLLFKILRRLIPATLFSPDNKITWYLPAYKMAEEILKTYKVDLIYSRAFPFTSHLVALKLKKKFGLPWVAHFSDPWIDNFYIAYEHRLHYRINLNMEKQVALGADALVFVTKQAKDLFLRKYPLTVKQKSFVISHSFDPEFYLQVTRKTNDNNFILTYAGSLWGDRTPEGLFLALRMIKHQHPEIYKVLHLQIIGSISKKFVKMVHKLRLEECVNVMGMQPYFSSLRHLLETDLLILIDAAHKDKNVFLPSKLMDYLWAHKPILGLTPEDSPSASILRRLNCVVVKPQDRQAIKENILVFYKRYKENKLSQNLYDLDKIRTYSTPKVAHFLIEVFNKVSYNFKSIRYPAAIMDKNYQGTKYVN